MHPTASLDSYFWCFTQALAVAWTPLKTPRMKAYVAAVGVLYPDPVFRELWRRITAHVDMEQYIASPDRMFQWVYEVRSRMAAQRGGTAPPLQALQSLYFGRIAAGCESCTVTGFHRPGSGGDATEGGNGNDLWGPCGWVVIHTFAAGYDPSLFTFDVFVAFMDALTGLLPCETCNLNLQKKLDVLPLAPYRGDWKKMFFWTYTVHDMANQYLGKRSPPLETARTYYRDLATAGQR